MSLHFPQHPHALPKEALVAELETDTVRGLTREEAALRLERYGQNVLPRGKKTSALAVFLKQFHSGLTYILMAAGLISSFLGDFKDATAILVVIMIGVVFGFVQERRADSAVEALKQMVVPEAAVIRDGQVHQIPAQELVPGDLIELSEGDRVPADGRLIRLRDLRTDESALTGESVPAAKNKETLLVKTPLPDRKNMVYMGTSVVAGLGRALVTTTGGQTAFGQVASSLVSIKSSRTPFESALDRLGWRLGLASLVVVSLASGIGLLNGEPLSEMFIFAVALAVALIPEGLPSVLTMVLAIGVWRMARRKAVVRHVPSVETLGQTDVICTDKTGTLTRNQMTVRDLALFGADIRVSGEGYEPKGNFTVGGKALVPGEIPGLNVMLKAAALGTAANIVLKDDRYSVVGDPTEGALAVAATKAGFERNKLRTTWEILDEMPFSSERKLRAVLVEGEDYAGKRTRQLFVIGAYEVLVTRSSQYMEEQPKEFDKLASNRFDQANAKMASKARRVVAIAIKEMPATVNRVKEADLEGLTFIGLAGLIDPPRPEATKAIARCRRAGIRIIMITGDQKATAAAVGTEVGLLNLDAGVEQVFDEQQVQAMSDQEFESALDTATIFARATPATKLRLIDALKKRDHLVAMTGDGVNDAPALKKADIGISMGKGGTDVARQVSDMVLLDDNFATVVSAVEEGRVVFRNVKQTTAYLFTTNMAEAVTILLALAVGLPVPLLAGQILWMNLVTDGFPDIALATEPAGKGVLDDPPIRRNNLITNNVLLLALVTALLMCVMTIGFFGYSLGQDGDLTKARTMAFTTMCLLQLWNVFNLRHGERSILDVGLFSNRYLIGAVILSFLLQLAVLYLPFLNSTFTVVPLNWHDLALITAVTFIAIPVVEGYKWLLRRNLIPKSWE